MHVAQSSPSLSQTQPGIPVEPRLWAPGLRRHVEQSVAFVFGVDVGELRRPTRGPAAAAFARQVAMYLVHVGCGLSLTETGRLFERDRTTVAHACGVVEDRRDDRALDQALDWLERAARHLAAAEPGMWRPDRSEAEAAQWP